MKSLSLALLQKKNAIASGDPWLYLLDVDFKNGTVLYFVKNNEDVTFNGQLYTALSFEVDPPKESNDGKLQTAQIRVSNVGRVLQGYIEPLNGVVGAAITLRSVNVALLSESYADLTAYASVLSTSSDAQWVTFEIGAENLLNFRFPQYRYIAMHCNWQFGQRECNWASARRKWAALTIYYIGDTITPGNDNGHSYKCTTGGTSGGSQPTFPTGAGATVSDGSVVWTETGSTASCKRTFDECTRLANQQRYGGFHGLNNYGIKLGVQ